MMHPVCEGDYCKNGLRVVTTAVEKGLRPLELLVQRVSGVCTHCGEHTPACVQHFHHHIFDIPAAHAEVALAACERQRGAQAGWEEALETFFDQGEKAVALASVLTSVGARAAFKIQTLCRIGVPATALSAVLHVLPRHVAMQAPCKIVTVADAHAATEVQGYRDWLQGLCYHSKLSMASAHCGCAA